MDKFRGYLTISDRPILATVVNATKELAGNAEATNATITDLNSQILGYQESSVDLTGQITDLTDRITAVEDTTQTLTDEVAALRADIAAGSTTAGVNTDGIFNNGITVSGLSVFSGIVNFTDGTIFDKAAQFKEGIVLDKAALFNKDAAGRVTLQSGDTSVDVTFDQAYDVTPIVTVTPRTFLPEGTYRVISESETGFTIEVESTQTDDINFAWTAVQTQ